MSDGFTLKVIAANGEPPTALAEAQTIQAQLADINITVEIKSLELGVYVERWLDGDFEAAVALNGGRPDPYTMYTRYLPRPATLNSRRVQSTTARHCSPRGASRPIRGTQRHLRRVPALHHGTVAVGLALRRLNYTAQQPYVTGFVPSPTGSHSGVERR